MRVCWEKTKRFKTSYRSNKLQCLRPKRNTIRSTNWTMISRDTWNKSPRRLVKLTSKRLESKARKWASTNSKSLKHASSNLRSACLTTSRKSKRSRGEQCLSKRCKMAQTKASTGSFSMNMRKRRMWRSAKLPNQLSATMASAPQCIRTGSRLTLNKLRTRRNWWSSAISCANLPSKISQS